MNDNAKRSCHNNRTLRRKNDRKLLSMMIFTLIVIGSGLITLIWGRWRC